MITASNLPETIRNVKQTCNKFNHVHQLGEDKLDDSDHSTGRGGHIGCVGGRRGGRVVDVTVEACTLVLTSATVFSLCRKSWKVLKYFTLMNQNRCPKNGQLRLLKFTYATFKNNNLSNFH